MLTIGTVKLPDEAVTQTFAILGKRGSGKTTTARVMTEELLSADLPVVVLDPMGVWWGLRSSADGKEAGYPAVIFGGEHADVPLEATAGELIADVVVNERTPAVLDLSLLSKGAGRTFVTAFLERLYLKNRDALHVVIDEADLFAPQRADRGQERLIGAMNDLVRRGRARGLGTTLITQRPQVLHKDVLSQAEVLIAHRMVGVRDIAAIDEWVRVHADDDEAKDVKATLPSLPIGTAWFWSPGWLELLQKVAVQLPTTFDSSATPRPGEKRRAVKRMAAIDLEALGERITATVDRAKAEDPRTLKAKITELGRDLEAARNARPDPERVEVPVLSPEVRADLQARLDEVIAALKEAMAPILAVLERLGATSKPTPTPPRLAIPPFAVRPVMKPLAAPSPNRPPAASGDLPPARLKILNGLAELDSIGLSPADKVQLAMWIGVSPRGGSYNNNLGALRSAGLLTYPSGGMVAITEEGRTHTPDTLQVPTRDVLHDRLRDKLPPARWRILEAVIAAYPNPVDRGSLADSIGVAAGGGSFNNNLGALRTLGLLDYPDRGWVVGAPVLFLEAS